MATNFTNPRKKIASANTWTELAQGEVGPPKIEKLLDLTVQNFTANANTVLLAITASNSAPALDTADDVFMTFTLAKKLNAAGGDIQFLESIPLLTGQYLWIKSDQTDTRTLVTGTKQVEPA